jgi:alanine-glyoxylate transaminase/(R)-3-amino-2-methylpropionate-pyruvate transaminase
MTNETDWPADAIVASCDRYFAASQRAFVPYRTRLACRSGQGQHLWDEKGSQFIDLAWAEDRAARSLPGP